MLSETVQLTKDLVRIPSENPNGNEIEMAHFVRDWLRNTGADVYVEKVAPGRNNIIARIEGEEDMGNLVYVGHMDTVPAGEGWSCDPFSGDIKDGKLYGRGSADMKGGLAAAMVSFKRIAASGEKPKRTFILIASVDEEGPGMIGAIDAVERGWVKEDSMVVAAEPSGLTVMPAHKGPMWFEITSKGKMSHAGNPQVGVDAIHAMAAILSELKISVDELTYDDELLGRPTVTIGKIGGGVKTNVVPDECKAEIDLRLIVPMTVDEGKSLVQVAIDKGTAKVAGSSASYTVLTIDRPPIKAAADSPLIAAVDEAVEKVSGKKAEHKGLPAYTDASIIAARTGSKHCITFGPGHLAQAHTVDEYVPIDQLDMAADMLTETAKNLLW